ncbi:MAG: CRTAC1 family protein [Planctomycetaceae bacterium]|nr:CRTAC1 family protein [Planctomycetaceae bacterium]
MDFVYHNGAQGQLLMVESLGGGVAWTDFDRDGRLDLFFCEGGIPNAAESEPRPTDRLYRQIGELKFQRCDASAGVIERQYGQGVAAGDFDNDGFPDLYVTNVGPNSFFENMGDGTFLESAGSRKLDDPRWSSSAAWGDLDLDGDLDLYVCNYVQYDPYDPMKCEKDGLPALCHPRQIPHWPDECFENLGDGRFAPRSADWHLQGDGNKGLGVAIADFSNDGWPDIYVANDTTPNFLFVNQQGKGFAESALRLGAALSGDGAMQASMGVAVGDYDRSGTLDLFLTHFTGESHTLYQNLGEYGFSDVSGLTGIHHASFPKLGFGTVMTDFDANGTTELLTAHGHIDDRNADGDGYEQNPQLLTRVGDRWIDCSATSGDYYSQKLVGRGMSLGDFDHDGDQDICVVHQNSPTAILRNDSEPGSWLRLRFVGTAANRFGIGTRVTLRANGEPVDGVWELVGGTSYCSTHEPVLQISLNGQTAPITLVVRWPNGEPQELEVDRLNQMLTLVQLQSALEVP